MSHVTRTLTRGGLLLILAAVLSCFVAVPLAGHASASTSTPSLSTFDSRLLYDINHARTIRGIRALKAVAGSTDVAHRWSCHMAGAAWLSHNAHLGTLLESHGSYYWTTYGENVGMVPTTSGADTLFHAYMNSAPHRANILDPDFKYIGVFTKRTAVYRWNTLDFVGRYSSSYNYGYGATRRTC